MHSSWADDRASSYERLEFLGDSVLELAIARTVFDRFPDASEGRLAKIRAHVVSRQSCAVVAKELGLGGGWSNGPATCRPTSSSGSPKAGTSSPRSSRRRSRPSISSTASRRSSPRSWRRSRTDRVRAHRVTSTTRPSCRRPSRARGSQVHYTVSRSRAHRTTAVSCAPPMIAGEQLGIGKGSTKKAAEQEAASQALDALGVVPEAI